MGKRRQAKFVCTHPQLWWASLFARDHVKAHDHERAPLLSHQEHIRTDLDRIQDYFDQLWSDFEQIWSALTRLGAVSTQFSDICPDLTSFVFCSPTLLDVYQVWCACRHLVRFRSLFSDSDQVLWRNPTKDTWTWRASVQRLYIVAYRVRHLLKAQASGLLQGSESVGGVWTFFREEIGH